MNIKVTETVTKSFLKQHTLCIEIDTSGKYDRNFRIPGLFLNISRKVVKMLSLLQA